MGDLGLRQALIMGLAQALALAPGVSRSGITITAGRFMKLDRDSAARFSFYLLLPTVLGAVLLKGVQDVLLGELPAGWTGPFLVGTLAALGSGLLAIEWLLGYVRTRTPNETEMVLRRKLPRRHWKTYNDLLVTFGQNLCVPVSPWCSRCPVARHCDQVGLKRSR